jgi:hypothetical protein
VIVAVVDAAAATVSIVNVWLVVPLLTCTFAGTDADALLLESETSAPPAGADAVSVTVPITSSPPAVDNVDNDSDWSAATVVDGADVLDDPLQATMVSVASAAPAAATARVLSWIDIGCRAAVQAVRHVRCARVPHLRHDCAIVWSQIVTSEDTIFDAHGEAEKKSQGRREIV